MNAGSKKNKTSPSDSMQRIIDSAKQGKLIVVTGAGLSMGLTNGVAPSWKGLIENGFSYALNKGRMTQQQSLSWEGQLKSNDVDDLLGAAEFMGRKLGASTDPIYARWLQSEFSSITPQNAKLVSAIRTLSSLNIPICTLNYDSLLERITGLPTVLVSETTKATAWMRREYPAIFHLHGHWDNPSSCILGIRDYETTQIDQVRDLFQRNLAAFNHLLFIGCGDTFSDPNFSALIGWLRTKLMASTPQHVALTLEADVATRNADNTWAGFVEPISYGKSHENLADFLTSHFSYSSSKKIKQVTATQTDKNSVLANYKSFLIKDCGQMTIEGVSADMDTGQRRFDLERLFVPLQVSACPPEFNQSDPDRVEKLKKWHRENNGAIPFGKALATQKRIALLALPGGGKTLLLKRLAVAYAAPARRGISGDQLPNLDLTPILIRCREWRDHIKLPIPTLLKNIADITGQHNLSGLLEAAIPLFKKGSVLLLIDGLDEIHDDAERTIFVDNLESFLEDYKLTRVVVTSREAGFNLVAPSIARFCERWRLAPLEENAIFSLCRHWHRLMNGDNPSSLADGEEVAQILLKNQSLRRLAENPLLLTMLLVVKHGAGGLPPDRVSLYSRAVEVLLDTWNIKGHAPLNIREAVPQLSYVAFKMMCIGKQTATEKELLVLLEEARASLPHIRRYAKDSPQDFLKRVELRSSLLLEVGHQMEDGRAVPFYQFRHLTFQEYLTAVAATEGHYKKYNQRDTVLTPISTYLMAEEWKEVIPMISVLARKQAEPLMAKLVQLGEKFRSQVEVGTAKLAVGDWDDENNKIATPASRLSQCLIEEAEASPTTLTSALQIVAFFAKGCQSNIDWRALCQGPYGQELFNQALLLFNKMQWPGDTWLMHTCACFAIFQKPEDYWFSDLGKTEVNKLLTNKNREEIRKGLLICMGLLWTDPTTARVRSTSNVQIELIEPHLAQKDSSLWSCAAWIWTIMQRRQNSDRRVPPLILDKLLLAWLSCKTDREGGTASYTLSCHLGIPRDYWTPKLKETQIKIVRKLAEGNEARDPLETDYGKITAIFVAYHAGSVWTDEEILDEIDNLDDLAMRNIKAEQLESVRITLRANMSQNPKKTG